MVHAACWAHSRRKFFEAMKLHPDDRIATRIVARIDVRIPEEGERDSGVNVKSVPG
jgi:hypothetical protein